MKKNETNELTKKAAIARMNCEAKGDFEGAMEMANEIVNLNMPLVKYCLKEYTNYTDYEDVLQQGYLGLIKAAKKYDPEVGCEFSTYAWNWIMCMVRRYIVENNRVRVPSVQQYAFQRAENRISNAEKRAKVDNQKRNELIVKSGLSPDMYYRIKNLRGTCLFNEDMRPLDAPIEEVGEWVARRSSYRALADNRSDIDDMLKVKAIKEYLSSLLTRAKLSEQELEILRERFGYGKEDEDDCLTLQEIGDMYSLNLERIRRIEAKALRKLRQAALYMHDRHMVIDILAD